MYKTANLKCIHHNFLSGTFSDKLLKKVEFSFEKKDTCLEIQYVASFACLTCQSRQTYSPVELQCDSPPFLTSVFGMRVFPAPAQNQPLILMGCRCSASQPLPLKLHLRPEVQMELTLSKMIEKLSCHPRILENLKTFVLDAIWIIAFQLTLTHEGGKEIVLSLGIKTDQVHASVPAKVASVEPVPILKLVPGLPPRQEVIVSAPLHVRDSCRWRTKS